MDTQFHQNPVIEVAPLQDEVILFHAPTNRFCVLNRTSSFIWSRLKGPATAKEIADEVGKHFRGVPQQEVLQDIDSVLSEMLSLELIVST